MSDGLKLIARVLIDGAGNTLRELPESLFIQDELRLFQFVSEHYRQHGVLPQAATATENTGIRVPDAPEPLVYYQEKLITRSKYNWLRDFLPQIRDCTTERDIEGALGLLLEGVRALRDGSTGQIVKNLAEGIESAQQELLRQQRSGGGIPSGWPTFDRTTNGYQPGNLYTWVARTGIGKSYAAVYQAHHAWMMGYSVMFVTFEMPIHEIIHRTLGFMLQVDPRGFHSGTVSTQLINRISTVLTTLEGASRYHVIGDDLTPKIGNVISYIQEYQPDIVFLDGAQFMQPDVSSKYANRLERVNDTWDELKRITTRQRIPVVVNAQFNRQSGAQGKDGSLSTIGLTDLISQHSSVVMKMSPANNLCNRLSIEMMKNRHGPALDFEINFRFNPPDLRECSEDDAWDVVDHDVDFFSNAED